MKDYSGGYYEAILQIRPSDKKVIDFVLEEIAKKNNVFITRKIEKKFGIDFYITSYRFAAAIGRNLKKRFNGDLVISKQLYSVNRQTSKFVYRVTVLFRLKR